MIRISMIQTSQNRRNELLRFVESIKGQNGVNLSEVQLIFVDQENNGDVFDSLKDLMEVVIIKSSHCSLSHARNVGIPYVKGEIVCFPDDDCWYEPDTLINVLQFFDQNKQFSGVTGIGLNEDGVKTHTFPDLESEVLPERRCAAISYTMFYRFDGAILFNENIGVGSPYNLGAGEETDYMLNLMEKKGYKVFYNPQIIVHHPALADYSDKEALLKKFYSYSRGGGYLMRLHRFSLSYKFKTVIRPLGGIIVYALKFNKYLIRKYYYVLKGTCEGYFFQVDNKS